MNEELLECYNKVNKAETIGELKQAIIFISEKNGDIPGRKKYWSLDSQLKGIDAILAGYSMNVLTRSFGIRQQMMYIMHYNYGR